MQSQLKSRVIAWSFLVAVLSRCVLVYVPDFGVFGAAAAFDISGWVSVFGMFGYSVFGGCPLTRNGFSMRAFSGIWDFCQTLCSCWGHALVCVCVCTYVF
ncbi:hypothetical protein WN944_007974 [Citrus x changshan-huyou]|uniref:Uncharacterized protein n=1 Tax=Citrus x changshan-huyou TaxID=2935761 RepID=A0AAP0MNY7_9ROSI